MRKLPALNGNDVVKALQRAGFVWDRQRGSHVILYRPETNLTVTVPMHRNDLQPGILHAIIRDAGLTFDEFAEYLK